MNHDTNESMIDRRTFCNRALLTSAGVMLTARQLAAARPQPDKPVMYPPKKIEGAEKVMPGSFLYFSYPRARDAAVLVRGEDGQYMAFRRECAHLGCSVDFDALRRCLACPCHGGAYDCRTGSVLYGPPPRSLTQVVLQMRAGGEVWAVGTTIGDLNSRPSPPGKLPVVDGRK